jgi:hypothetical protein
MSYYQAHLTQKSENTKTGPIPVSTVTRETCPPSCPLKENGCYAEVGKVAIHWRRVSEGSRGKPWDEFCLDVEALPKGQLWRHCQSGDQPGKDGRIDREALEMLTRANTGKKGFSYTHYDVTGNSSMALWNATAVRDANRAGFLLNASCESLEQVDKAIARGIPAVVVLPEDAPATGLYTPNGTHVPVCPAQYQEGMTCKDCKLCANPNRTCAVGFRVHGVTKRKAAAVVADRA